MPFRSIKTKLAVAFGSCFVVIVSILITYSSLTLRNRIVKDAEEQAMQTARRFSAVLKAEIEGALDTARTLASALSAVKDPNSPLDIGRDQVNNILAKVLEDNPSFLATYTLWEPNAFDQMDSAYANLPGHDRTGRFIPYWSRGPKGLVLAPLFGYETAGLGDYYLIPKRTRREAMIEPYRYPVQGEEVLITSLVVPIIYGNEFYGIAGVDILLSTIQQRVVEAELFGGNAELNVLSHHGTIVAASGQDVMQGKALGFLHRDWKQDLVYIQNGDDIFEEDEGHFAVFTPIVIGRTETPWCVNLNIPLAMITEEAAQQMWFSIVIGIAVCLFAVMIVNRLIGRIVASLAGLTKIAEKVAQGDLDYENIKTSHDEIGLVNAAFSEVAQSLREITGVCEAVALGDFTRSTRVRSDKDVLCLSINQMTETLTAVVKQANAVASGDYTSEITPRSEADELGTALANMTLQLRDTVAENQRENWFKTGQAELNDKMRGEQSIADLTDNIITQIASYLDAQIGALFLAEDDQTLKLESSYAYTRRKGISNEFHPGQGLVGQAFKEKKGITIANVPEDYIEVQSGVGQAVPRHIMVMPFLHDQKAMGVLELGSFQAFTSLQVHFLETVSENIAIAINAAQSRDRMSELLEKTQLQSEELQTQQEELKAANEGLEEQTQQLRQSEEVLKSKQQELELTNARLEEQTAELEEQKHALEGSWNQIQAKSQELEMANKYKSEFLSNMSHELRTPLNSLLILARLLMDNQEGNLTEEQVESSRMIYGGGQELLSLINEILDLAKIEAGKMEFNFGEVSLSDLAQGLENDFMPTAKEKSLAFHVEVAEGLPDCICTDEKRTRQILKNLLSNAFKFTSKGRVSARISRPEPQIDLSQSHLDHRTSIAIAISDTGIGIARAKQAMVFEAFQQADGNIDRRYGGTGLGLSISTCLAKFLGGEIQLQSEEGQGSTFTLYLPDAMTKVPGDSGEAARRPGLKQATLSPSPAPIRTVARVMDDDRGNITADDRVILIIEDDAKFARILQNMSHNKGFKCLIACNGEAGLTMAVEDHPEAIILDVGLPGINGFNVINGLKDNPATRHIPVHFISACDEDQSIKALSLGAIGYLTKPASKEQLDQVFSRLEQVINSDIKKLLVAADNVDTRESIVKLIENEDVEISAVGSGQEAYDLLKMQRYDCMVLDLGSPDISGFDLLDQLEHDDDIIARPPVVVYSSKDLSRVGATALREHSGNVILKGVESPERLLDETSLFLHRIEALLPPAQQRMIRKAHEKETVLCGKKVLIVDDNLRNIFALSHALKSKGMTVIRAEDGQKALDMLEIHPDIDIVLMDIMMPVMDGYEAMHRIRAQAKYTKLPILALTAKAMQDDRQKCIDAGANDYVAKPIDVDKVLSMLRVWLYV